MLTSIGVGFVLAAVLGWTAVVALGSDLTPIPLLMVGVSMILTATIATVGILVTSSRWSRRLALISLAMGPAAGLSAPIDTLWLTALVLTVAAAAVLVSPTLVIRKLPSATGPPPKAVLLPLVLVICPFSYGLAADNDPAWALLVAGVTALVAAFLYARVVPGGLLAVRYIWPGLALALSFALETVAAVTSVALALAVAVLAWSSDAKTAFHPPRQMGTRYPIPPELSPTEILDAANIDEHGRPR
ncbi:MAG: hypothetical protein R3258_08140 [Acidimicrobiia bacterium]|nr:hypothetical protein [Acidimicrobiia bacterium]